MTELFKPFSDRFSVPSGILINIWLPAAVSHVAADKFVHLNHVLVVGTSPSFDCASDSPPRNSYITSKVRSPRAREGGHVGFLLTTFMSGGGLAPKKPWNMVMSAPALRGVTKLNGTGFAHFGVRCTKSSVAITTNPGSGDAFHPVEVRALKLFHVSPEHFMYIRPPALGLVNPSDCVDMDCDGNKHVVFKDLDGSLTGQAGGSVIAKAEFEWNGDPRRGLGLYFFYFFFFIIIFLLLIASRPSPGSTADFLVCLPRETSKCDTAEIRLPAVRSTRFLSQRLLHKTTNSRQFS